MRLVTLKKQFSLTQNAAKSLAIEKDGFTKTA